MKRAPQELRTYFLTAVTAQRRSLFQVHAVAELLLETIQSYRLKQKFELYSFVVMPDHVHLLLSPAPDVSLEKVAQYIKGGFSFRYKTAFDVWERGYFDKRIADRTAFDACRRYIEQNPVEEHLAATADGYAFTSLRRPEMIDPDPVWFSGYGQG